MPAPIDLTGKRLEGSVVVGLFSSSTPEHRNRNWLVRCDCGIEFRAQTQAITGGITKWCRRCSVHRRGHFSDHTGRRFGTWTVVGRSGTDKHKSPLWLLECVCGFQKTRSASAINKMVGKCRCQKRIPSRLHCLYPVWTGMRMRCLVKTNPKYQDYGGRGITICDRWLRSGDGFWNFVADMGARPPGTSLDRIDVNGNYEPGNCQWATPQEQSDNQRRSAKRIAIVLDNALQMVEADDGLSARDMVILIRRELIGLQS